MILPSFSFSNLDRRKPDEYEYRDCINSDEESCGCKYEASPPVGAVYTFDLSAIALFSGRVKGSVEMLKKSECVNVDSCDRNADLFVGTVGIEFAVEIRTVGNTRSPFLDPGTAVVCRNES